MALRVVRIGCPARQVLDPKKARRRARVALQKELLRAEQAKADQALAACLPMLGALQTGGGGGGSRGGSMSGAAGSESGGGGGVTRLPSATLRSGAFGGGDASGGLHGRAGGGGGGLAASGGSGGPNSPSYHHAMEYARTRGLYRGDTQSWCGRRAGAGLCQGCRCSAVARAAWVSLMSCGMCWASPRFLRAACPVSGSFARCALPPCVCAGRCPA
jgi:hypothetical protein